MSIGLLIRPAWWSSREATGFATVQWLRDLDCCVTLAKAQVKVIAWLGVFPTRTRAPAGYTRPLRHAVAIPGCVMPVRGDGAILVRQRLFSQAEKTPPRGDEQLFYPRRMAGMQKCRKLKLRDRVRVIRSGKYLARCKHLKQRAP